MRLEVRVNATGVEFFARAAAKNLERLSGKHRAVYTLIRARYLAQFLPNHEAKACTYCAWQEHVAIVDAVEQRDTTAAIGLMTQHLDHLESKLLKLN